MTDDGGIHVQPFDSTVAVLTGQTISINGGTSTG